MSTEHYGAWTTSTLAAALRLFSDELERQGDLDSSALVLEAAERLERGGA